MKISKTDLINLKDVKTSQKIILNNQKYFAKPAYSANKIYTPLNTACNELIGYEIAKEFGLLCPKYYIVSDEDENYYILSEDLNKYGFFATAEDIGLNSVDGSSLYTIWDFLESHYGNNPQLFNDVIKMYIMDLFLSNSDRRPANWGIIYNHKQMQLAIFDNVEMFIYKYLTEYISPLENEDWFKKLIYLKQTKKNTEKHLEYVKKQKVKNIGTFLKESSEEYINLFNEYYEKMTSQHYLEILNRVEDENVIYTANGEKKLVIPNKDILMELYMENYNIISKVLNSYLDKGRNRR